MSTDGKQTKFMPFNYRNVAGNSTLLTKIVSIKLQIDVSRLR